jgi:diguanylate cyclase (GGDEF)-like protein
MRWLLVRHRLSLLGAVIVIAIAGTSGLIVDMQRLASIDAFRIATTNLGNGMAHQTTQQLASIDRGLSDLQTAVASILDATPGATVATLTAPVLFNLLTERSKLSTFLESLAIVDANGLVANATRGSLDIGATVAGTDFFTYLSTNDDRTLFVGTPVRNGGTGKWTSFVMARRVATGGGRFAGIVVANVSLPALTDFFNLAMPGLRSVSLIRRDGLLLFRYPMQDDEIGRTISGQTLWHEVVARGGGAYHAPDHFDPIPVIASVHPVPNLPFVVETSVTEALALDGWYRQRTWIVGGGIAGSVMAVGLLHLFGLQFRRVEKSERSLSIKNRELDTARQQLNAALANMSQGVCFFSGDQRLIVCNRRYSELYDLPPDSIQPGVTIIEVDDLRREIGSFPIKTNIECLNPRNGNFDDHEPHYWIAELRNGRTVAINHQPMPDGGWVATHEDITSRREAEEKIKFLARHDVLTGLANRALFQERLEQALALAERGKGFALLALDLDRFKAVNDTLGHGVGDDLLRAVAERLLASVRESDTVARLGGDEFAILQLDVVEMTDTTVLARRLVQSISAPYELDGHKVNIGTSIGIAMAPADGNHPLQLMKNADLALYRSKEGGRGTWHFFEASMDLVARQRRALELDLRLAEEQQQFEVHYQPMVSSLRRRVTGFEALLRWRHPTRGLLSPDDFMSVADEIGLMAEIGTWVLRQACAEAATWPIPLRVAVNLSPRQFRGQTLVGTVGDVLRESGLAPERLELEITESLPVRKDKAILEILRSLHATGVRIALDDFGSGYSSLSYLLGFPFDTIKIDRVFVAGLRTCDGHVAILRAITGLASSLRVNATAEGVETEEQFEFLVSLGCTEMQGYLFGKPVPASEVPSIIARLSGTARPAFSAFAGAAPGSSDW